MAFLAIEKSHNFFSYLPENLDVLEFPGFLESLNELFHLIERILSDTVVVVKEASIPP